MAEPGVAVSRVPDAGIRALYTQEHEFQVWLDVEVALAQAEAELAIIPTEAADAIGRAAHIGLLDRARIDDAALRSGHPLVPLIWELSRVVGEPHGGWVHWGATTQNIMQTGDMLILRECHTRFIAQLRTILTAMTELAERGADMVMAGRTHGQHAVPTTFGFKVAVWIDEVLRHLERLEQVSPRVFVAMFGGAAGTFASLGEQGPAVQAGMAARLHMLPMTIPARTIADPMAEYICILGLLAGTCGKIGREIYTLMKTEFGEVEEPVPPGTVGSSTMPQKRNPSLSQDVISFASEIRSLVPLALESLQTEHEADATTHNMMRPAQERACILTGDMLARLVVILQGLRLEPERMRRNLDLSGGLIVAEAVMLELGARIGRQHAHDVVYDAAQEAFTGQASFADLLAANVDVAAHMAPERVAALLDPVNYTGLSSQIARAAVMRAREKLGA